MKVVVIAAALGLSAGPVLAQQATAPAPAAPAAGPTLTPAPAGAQAYIIAPTSGARVHSPVLVRFGLKGMGVTQAGSSAKNAGHHHLLVDVTEPLNLEEAIPADKKHLHFGGGQTETTLDLPPGPHTLQLVLGDAGHRPFAPSIESDKVNIVVVPPNQPLARNHPRKRTHRHVVAAPAPDGVR